MKQRILFLLRIYITTVILFLCAKSVFMWANRTAHTFSLKDMTDVWLHGLTLDLSTALYFLIIPFLIIIASIWWTGKGIYQLLHLWFAVTATAFALAFVADTCLYPFWGFKLDASCLQYLSSPEAAMASVAVKWLILGAVGLIALGYVIFRLYKAQIPSFQPLQRKWRFGILCFLAIPLMFIGIRGGVEESTTNIGQVYYSATPFLNHAAVNPVFSFLSSFEGSVRSDIRYTFFSDEKCDSLFAGLYDTHSIIAPPNKLLRTQRPDILIITLEGTGGQFTKIGGKTHVMPYLNQLMDESVNFTECYANSYRTDRATVCIWSGYPSFPTMSLQKIPAKNRSLPSIAHSLRRAGYDTHYYYGGDINFTKMKSYLINAGFERLTSKSDFTHKEQRTAQWGVCDSIVLKSVADEIATWDLSAGQPHLIGCLTLSSHEPWDVPGQYLEMPEENAFHYLDRCLRRFVSQLRQLPQWDNLLVIFIPDHGTGTYGLDETSPLKMHIPFLWTGGAIKEARKIDVLCNQTDLAATLLGQLGLPHDDFRFSRDVLSETYTRPFAYHTFNNGFSLVDSTRFTAYDLTAQHPIAGQAPDLIERGKAILQVTSQDLADL